MTAYKPGLDGSYEERGLQLSLAFLSILYLLLYSSASENTIHFISNYICLDELALP